LPSKTASVVVLKSDGRLLLQFTGKLKPEERTAVFEALKGELNQ
jgi:hypothetical protein